MEDKIITTKEEAKHHLFNLRSHTTSLKYNTGYMDSLKLVPQEFYQDKTFVMEVLNGIPDGLDISNNPYIYPLLPDNLKQDKDVLKIVAGKGAYSANGMDVDFNKNRSKPIGLYDLFDHLPDNLKEDIKLCKTIAKNGRINEYKSFPDALKNDIDIAFDYAKGHRNKYRPNRLDDLPESVKDNPKFLVKYSTEIQKGNRLENRLHFNKEALEEFFKTGPVSVINKIVYDNEVNPHYKVGNLYGRESDTFTAIPAGVQKVKSYVDEVLQNKEVFLAYVARSDFSPDALLRFSPDFIGDKALIGELVKSKPHIIAGCPANITSDKDIVLESVSRNGDLLKYASDELKNDKDIVVVAAKNDYHALDHASKQLRDDENFISTCINSKPHSLMYASDRLRNDKKIVLQAFKIDPQVFHNAGKELREEIGKNDFGKYMDAENLAKRFEQTLTRKPEQKSIQRTKI